MSRSIVVSMVPALVADGDLTNKTVAVIDVLRATTTLVYALAAGATEIFPCLETDQARRQAADIGGDVLLGGERRGVKIDGFDLGNSPAEYVAEKVAGRSIVFTTTNGTRALERCRDAGRVLIASFANLTAVCGALAESDEVAILCAGTAGRLTREDVLVAGAMTEQILAKSPAASIDDSAQVAVDAWRGLRREPPNWLAAELRNSRGGRNLARIGHAADIDMAARVDRFDVVPRLDLAAWRIHLP